MVDKSFPLRTLTTLHAFLAVVFAAPPRLKLSASAGGALAWFALHLPGAALRCGVPCGRQRDLLA
jgi:hypothetical protein